MRRTTVLKWEEFAAGAKEPTKGSRNCSADKGHSRFPPLRWEVDNLTALITPFIPPTLRGMVKEIALISRGDKERIFILRHSREVLPNSPS